MIWLLSLAVAMGCTPQESYTQYKIIHVNPRLSEGSTGHPYQLLAALRHMSSSLIIRLDSLSSLHDCSNFALVLDAGGTWYSESLISPPRVVTTSGAKIPRMQILRFTGSHPGSSAACRTGRVHGLC